MSGGGNELQKLLRELDLNLRQNLKCPLLSKYIAKSYKNEEEEGGELEEDEIGIRDPKDREIFDNFKHFILPGKQRIALIEWLLETYEPGILKSQLDYFTYKTSQLRVLETLLKQLGIINFS